jgi:hypothetical protein
MQSAAGGAAEVPAEEAEPAAEEGQGQEAASAAAAE